MTDATTGPDHAALMDETYRHQRWIYDLTRKYYLLGRDRLIDRLDPPPGALVLEIACGTGRNLAVIARRHPGRPLYGLDISTEMLRSAEAKLGTRARLAQGDACAFDPEALFGVPAFERIVLSYALSMIPDWTGALDAAACRLAPGGALHIVDFGPMDRLPRWFRAGLDRWLAKFHVTPRRDLPAELARCAARHGLTVETETPYRGYARLAVLRRAP